MGRYSESSTHSCTLVSFWGRFNKRRTHLLNSLVTSVCGSVRCIWVPRCTVHQPHLLPLGHHAVPWNRNQENKNITHLHWFNSANVRPPFSQKGKDPGIKGCNFSFIGWDLIVLFTDDPRLHILTNSVQS